MIAVAGLCKRFGAVRAVDGCNLSLEPGTTLVIPGPSGSGKTTLLRLIAGLEHPDAGRVVIDGRLVSSPETLVPPHLRGLGMVFQDLALWPHMSVFANVAFGLRGGKASRRQLALRVDEVLATVSLSDKSHCYPRQLSGGERQRLAIARAIAPRPACLLMDEPFSSLDPVLKLEMAELLLRIKTQLGTSIIYVTHNLDEALHLGDRVEVMNHGRLRGSIGPESLAKLSAEELLAWYRSKV